MTPKIQPALRNLLLGVVFVLCVAGAAVAGYVACGWSLGDAVYMVTLTVFTVGYDEVHPIDTAALRAITIALIGLGCTGMIFLTGALVQFITFSQLQDLLGTRRMRNQIDALRDHVIICGFGRMGSQIARDLHAGHTAFVVIERSDARCEAVRALGYMAIQGDAAEEGALTGAGIGRAGIVATVLPDDAANVFITLTARALNEAILIIARGEAPSTERKLIRAGANHVVLPALIGAERVAELILFPQTAETMRQPARLRLEAELRRMGMTMQVVIATQNSAFAGLSVAEIERRAGHGVLIVSVERPGGAPEPGRPDLVVAPGDGVTVIAREGVGSIWADFGGGG